MAGIKGAPRQLVTGLKELRSPYQEHESCQTSLYIWYFYLMSIIYDAAAFPLTVLSLITPKTSDEGFLPCQKWAAYDHVME